uniref:RBR-type E3 ubiquitin transferase n=1 Tax=Lotharella oceanica TaxID=641309 RepID=A0A7S2XA88_9EUKA
MPKEACMHLLRSLRWDEEKLTTEFVEKGKLLMKEHNLDLLLTESKTPAASLVCKICFDNTPINQCFALGCNHWFCRGCWKDYLVDRVDTTGTRAPQSHCPMFKCKARIPDSAFSRFLDKPRVQKYDHASLNAYVSEKSTLRWCPAPRCGKIISASGLVTSVRCICGQSFCFRCNEEDHQPVTCEQVQKWQAKCDKESETAQWIISNTKKCPKCLVRIEKNQGCNHMTCHCCKYEFCWVCMGPWKDHGNHTGGFYKCNKYNPHKAKVKDESKAELDRFLHYYQRYHNHDQARKFAKEQIETSEKRMAELHTQAGNSDSQWQNVQFLRKSTMQVLECRRVLKYTYVYGYYCTDAKERELFEFLQEDLEKATEKLSELSEQPLGKMKRQEVVDFTMFTEKFLRNLLSGLEDGLTKERT